MIDDGYESQMNRLKRGDMKLAVSCYDVKVNRSSRDARELLELFPDFEQAF